MNFHREERYGIRWKPLHELMGVPAQVLMAMPQGMEAKDWELIKSRWYTYHIERNMLLMDSMGRRPKQFITFRHHASIMSGLLWGNPDGLWHFEFNPNACDIIDRFYEHKWLGIAGCKSSSKTESIVWLSLMYYLIDPQNSKVLVGSKTIDTALGKIWASIDLAWRQASVFFGGESMMPGVMVLSKAYIYDKVMHRKCGLEVIPGEQSSIKKSAEKLQGYKGAGWKGRLMFATDETATMSHAIINTAVANLTGNANFKGVGGFNPSDEYDASRPLAEPVDGFSSVTVNDSQWKTKLGWCLHFDGEKSPNVIAGRDANGKYPWRGLYTRENLKEDTDFYIEKSAAYWQMVRGYWAPTGSDDCIYSAPEIRSYDAQSHAVFLNNPIKVAACDPAFKHDGDQAYACAGLLGLVAGNHGKSIQCLQVTELQPLAEEADKGQSKDEQVAEAFREFCVSRGIPQSNTAFDGTGGGGPWGTILRLKWGAGSLEVSFGGAPSDLPLPETDILSDKERQQNNQTVRTAQDRYSNKVSEIWHVGKSFIRSGQWKGLPDELVSEMILRKYKDSGGTVKVESKKEMKKRIGRSPDKSDAAMVLVHLCRERFSLVPSEKINPTPKKRKTLADEFSSLAYKPSGLRSLMKRFDISR